MNTTNYQTIRQTARNTGLPEFMLRSRLKQGKLPGYYSYSRYYVNVPMLLEMIESESRESVSRVGCCQ